MTHAPLTFGSLSVLVALLATSAWADPTGVQSAGVQSAGVQPVGAQVVAAAPAGASAPPSDASPGAAPAKLNAAADDDGGDAAAGGDNKIHGEVSVGVGSSGYREVSGAATAPLPDGGSASIAVDVGQVGPYRR